VAENDTQREEQDDSALEVALMDAMADDSDGQFGVEDPIDGDEYRMDGAASLFGTNTEPDLDLSLAAQVTDSIVEDIAPEIEAAGGDVAEVKKDVFEDIAPEDLPAQQVYPVPDIKEDDIQKLFDEYNSQIEMAVGQYKDELRKQGLDEADVAQAANQYTVSLIVGSGLAKDFDRNDREDLNDSTNAFIIGNNPIGALKKTGYDAALLAMERADGIGETIAAFAPGVAASEVMEIADAIQQGVVRVDADFLLRVDEVKKKDKNLSEYDAIIKVNDEFIKAGKGDYMSMAPVSDIEEAQREEIPVFGSETYQDVTTQTVSALAAYSAGKAGFMKGFQKARGGVKGRIFGGVLGASSGLGAYGLSKISLDSLYSIRFGVEDQDYDIPYLKAGKTARGVVDVAKAFGDAIPGMARFHQYMELNGPATRAALTTGIVNLAVDLGLADKISEMPSVKAFIETASEDPALSDQSIQSFTEDMQGWGFMPITWAIKTAYHPLVTAEMKEAAEKIGISKDSSYWDNYRELQEEVLSNFGIDSFLADKGKASELRSSMLQDILKEIVGTDEFRRLRNLEREEAFNRMLNKTNEEVGLKALEYNEDQFYKEYEKFVQTPEKYSEYDKKMIIDSFVNNSSWNIANEKWRGKQPNVKLVKSFIERHYELGGPDPDSNKLPEFYELFKMVKEEAPDSEIQSHLNAMPLGYVMEFNTSNEDPVWARPSNEEMLDFAKYIYDFKVEERGRKTTAIVQKGIQRSTMKLVNESGHGMMLKPTALQRVFQGMNYLDAAVDELPITTPAFMAPFLEKMGVPGGVYGTSSGVDRAIGTNLRASMPNYWARVSGYSSQLLGGAGTGMEEVYTAAGYKRSDPEYGYAALAHVIDFLPKESLAGSSVVNAIRFGGNLKRLSNNAIFKTANGRAASTLAILEALDGIRTSKSVDQVKLYHETLERIFREEIADGRNPLRFLTKAEQDLFDAIFLNGGRNPDHGKVAVEKATTKANNIRGALKQAREDIGDNEFNILRASPSYQRLRADIDRLVQTGVINAEYGDQLLSMIEYQAIVASKMEGAKFRSVEKILENTIVTYNKPPGAGINPTVRIVDVDNNPISGRGGVPKGYFEYDDRTGRAVINFFKDGDIDSVWKMEGHLISHIMGDDFKNRVFRFFDHEYTGQGKIRLTERGKEQFAAAWQAYRRTADNSNGYIRRLFDGLWLGLQDFWARLRRKPRVLPKELRTYWDIEFGALPSDMRHAQALSSGAIFHRLRSNYQSSDRAIGESALMSSRAQMIKDLGYDEPTIRSLFGDRKTTIVRSVLDETTGQTKRVVEQKYAPRQYDAVEAAVKALALIKTADFRKRFNLVGTNKRKYASVGTGRYHVSESILNNLINRVNSRLNGAMGEAWTQTKKKIFQVDRDGKNALADPSTYPTGVRQADVAAFADRMEAMTGKRDGMDVAGRQDFFVLNGRQEAGLKTLLQEIGNQPEADFLPIQLLDPYANLKILSNAEWNKIVDVLTDIEATPLNRRSRNTIEPGLSDSINKTLKRLGATEAIADWFDGFVKKFRKEDYLPDGSYDPGVIDILRGGVRRWKNAASELLDLSRTKDFAKIDTVGKFFKKYIDRSVSRVNLAYLDDLKSLINMLSGFAEEVETRAASDLAAAKASGVTPTPTPRFTLPAGPTIEKLTRRIEAIQELLDGVYGMTGREREALNVLRSVRVRLSRGEKIADFSENEAAIVVDAISVLHAGLKVKDDYVQNIGNQLLLRALALKGTTEFDFGSIGRQAILYKTYSAWFKGNLTYLFDQPDIISAVARERVVPGAQLTLMYGQRGIVVTAEELSLIAEVSEAIKRKVGTELPDANIRMIAMLTLMKMDEIQQEVAEELASYGYLSTKRELIGDQPFRRDISLSRERYLDRVVHYLNRSMSLAGMNRYGAVSKNRPLKPRQDAYGPTEQTGGKFTSADAFDELDLQAQHDANQILARGGIRNAREEAVFVNVGDKQFLLPKNMFDFLQEQMEFSYGVKFQLDWGKGGSGEYFLRGRPENRVERAINATLNAAARAASILGPTGFYTGLLIGTGGIPMIGYGMGVFIGGLSQLHLGSGATAVVRDAITGPLTLAETFAGTTVRGLAETDVRIPLTERYVGLPDAARSKLASLADSIQSRTSFTAGVLARLHGKNAAVPHTKPILMPDGRVFTADQIANSVRRYGWRSAMVDRFQDTKDINLFYERFSKSNPMLMTTSISTLLGLTSGATLGSSAVFGMTLGYMLKPGNIFTKAHKYYREAFSAIDSFLRVKILMDELRRGKTLEEASIRVRDVALDYSNLSEAEKSFIGRYFAFYTYFSQAMKLYTKTLMENPQRLINQLKFIQKTQQERTENQLAQGDLPSWDAFRAFIPFEINGQYFRLPFLIAGDTVAIPIEIFGALPFLFSGGQDRESVESLMKLFGRMSPALQYGTEIMFDVNPTTGRTRSKSGFVVPYEIIELDRRALGGSLYDALDVVHYSMAEIVLDENKKTGKTRVSLSKVDHPGRGVYVARNRKLYIALFDALQSPFTGRMGDNMLALSKANMGGFESMLDAVGFIQDNITDGDPILSKVGPLIQLGLVKNKDAGSSLLIEQDNYVDPMDPDIAGIGDKTLFRQNEQLSTARIDLLIEQGKAFEKDGRIYVYTDQYYPSEASKTIGMSLSPKTNKKKNLSMLLRARIAALKEITGDEDEKPQEVVD